MNNVSEIFADRTSFYDKFRELTNFRDFLKNNTGEDIIIEFKKEYVAKDKLCKIILGMMNSHGGAIVFGVDDNESHPSGLDKIKDKAQIERDIKNYLNEELIKYIEIKDFIYSESEYLALKDKKFQAIIVKIPHPEIPALAKNRTSDLYDNRIYVRTGSETVEANRDDIKQIIERSITYKTPKFKELNLKNEIGELKVLYENSPEKFSHSKINIMINAFGEAFAEKITNPHHPNESFHQFIGRMIEKKKNKIEEMI